MSREFHKPTWCARSPSVEKAALCLAVERGRRVLSYVSLVSKDLYVLGRSQRCDVSLEASSISRRHCIVAHKNSGGVFIFDLKSTHGTFIDDSRVYGAHPVLLPLGGRLRLGHSGRVFRLCKKPLNVEPLALNWASVPDSGRVDSVNLDPDRTANATGVSKRLALAENTWEQTLASKKPHGDGAAHTTDGESKRPTKKRKSVGFDVAVELKEVAFDVNTSKGKFEGLVSAKIVGSAKRKRTQAPTPSGAARRLSSAAGGMNPLTTPRQIKSVSAPKAASAGTASVAQMRARAQPFISIYDDLPPTPTTLDKKHSGTPTTLDKRQSPTPTTLDKKHSSTPTTLDKRQSPTPTTPLETAKDQDNDDAVTRAADAAASSEAGGLYGTSSSGVSSASGDSSRRGVSPRTGTGALNASAKQADGASLDGESASASADAGSLSADIATVFGQRPAGASVAAPETNMADDGATNANMADDDDMFS